MDLSRLPRHVAIIMDGNGRWAQRNGRPRVYGHIRGCGRAREIIREASNLGIGAVTLYAFSSENWQRPESEINVLMKLLFKWLIREKSELQKRNIRFRAVGRIDLLPGHLIEEIRATEELSKNHTGMNLTLALSYSSREEIVHAAKELARQVKDGTLALEEISEDHFSSELYTHEIGDPDLLIRTSGEQRISNFLLWQLAYTEFFFTERMWPEFRVRDFHEALVSFGGRERRFGMTSEQKEAGREAQI